MTGIEVSGDTIEQCTCLAGSLVFRCVFGRQPSQHFTGLWVEDLYEDILFDGIVIQARLELARCKFGRADRFGNAGRRSCFLRSPLVLVPARPENGRPRLEQPRYLFGRVHYPAREGIGRPHPVSWRGTELRRIARLVWTGTRSSAIGIG
jgi:hypothetical protein